MPADDMTQWAMVAAAVLIYNPDSKVHGANMGPTWVLSAPDGPHVGPMSLAINVVIQEYGGLSTRRFMSRPMENTIFGDTD